MKINKLFFATCFMLLTVVNIKAQDKEVKTDMAEWTYELRAGVNIGGIAPLPMPVEIRSIKSYNPQFNSSFAGEITKYYGSSHKFGTAIGLRVENKAMTTGADVKNYSTEIIQDGSRVAGYWTGYVKTEYNSNFLTLPITAVYRFNPKWKVKAGGFVSYRLDGYFKGYVSDGYLRNGTPTGAKIEFKDGNFANFNFDDELSRTQFGAILGGSYKASKRFNINADLTWGFKDSFKSDFNTISFDLYPIYLNFGFGYEF